MTKRLRSILSVVLAMAMIFAMATTAFAATTDVYMTAGPNTAWSTAVQPGNSVTLTAGPANSYYSFTGFDSAADAGKTTWSFNCGADLCTYTTSTAEVSSVPGAYVATITITPKAGVYGPISVKATSAETKSTVDLTAYVESATTKSDVQVASVEVADLVNYAVYEYGTDVSVAASQGNAQNPFNPAYTYYDEEGKLVNADASGCAQTYPTAGDALFSLVGADFEQGAGYVSSIKGVASDYPANHGWNYCVIRNGAIMPECRLVSASVFEVKAGDAIYWAYATEQDAWDYFNALVQ